MMDICSANQIPSLITGIGNRERIRQWVVWGRCVWHPWWSGCTRLEELVLIVESKGWIPETSWPASDPSPSPPSGFRRPNPLDGFAWKSSSISVPNVLQNNYPISELPESALLLNKRVVSLAGVCPIANSCLCSETVPLCPLLFPVRLILYVELS